MSFPLEDLRGKHIGQRIFIVGSGPSLNETDLSLLDDETVIAVNNVIVARDRIKIDYHCIWARNRWLLLVDSLIKALDESDTMKAVVSPSFEFLRPVLPLLQERSDICLIGRFRKKTPTVDRAFCKQLHRQGVVSQAPFWSHRWSWNISTCTFFAIKLALYMGASHLYLVGQDGRLRDKQSHFSDEGIHNEYRGKAKVMKQFCARMKKLTEKITALGVPVTDCTPDGALKIPKTTLEEACRTSSHQT